MVERKARACSTLLFGESKHHDRTARQNWVCNESRKRRELEASEPVVRSARSSSCPSLVI